MTGCRFMGCFLTNYERTENQMKGNKFPCIDLRLSSVLIFQEDLNKSGIVHVLPLSLINITPVQNRGYSLV